MISSRVSGRLNRSGIFRGMFGLITGGVAAVVAPGLTEADGAITTGEAAGVGVGVCAAGADTFAQLLVAIMATANNAMLYFFMSNLD